MYHVNTYLHHRQYITADKVFLFTLDKNSIQQFTFRSSPHQALIQRWHQWPHTKSEHSINLISPCIFEHALYYVFFFCTTRTLIHRTYHPCSQASKRGFVRNMGEDIFHLAKIYGLWYRLKVLT